MIGNYLVFLCLLTEGRSTVIITKYMLYNINISEINKGIDTMLVNVWIENGRYRVYTLLMMMFCLLLTGCSVEGEPMKELQIQPNETLFFSNPINLSQIGDPYIIKSSDGKYFCYPTSDANNGYKVWVSEDLITWEKQSENVYTKSKTSWAKGDFWAPEVYEWDDKFYMYYTARWKENNSLRIGLAISDSPYGPFIDVENEPLFDLGYAAIDANVLIDDDKKAYLYFSKDCSENIYQGHNESHIYGVLLSDDRKSIVGEPVLLAKPEQSWELQSGSWHWNEGPYVLKHDSTYYLMYSANFYSDSTYSLGYAVSNEPLGTFIKSEQNPILYTQKDWKDISGPGHHSVVLSPGGTDLYVAYHTHAVPAIGGANRQLNLDVMGFRDDGSMYINGPTITPQLKPLFKDQVNKVNLSIKNKEEDSINILTDGEMLIHTDGEKMVKTVSFTASKEIIIAFESTQTITTVLVYTGHGETTVWTDYDNLKIEFSNGYFTNMSSAIHQEGGMFYFSFDSIDVDWIRIFEPSQNSKASLAEIMVF